MPLDIYINCSELSSFIGQNKWDYWSSFIKLWKKVDLENYKQCEELSKNEGKIVQNDKLKELKETLGETFIKETVSTTNKKSDVVKNIVQSVELIDKLDVSDEKKLELKMNMESLVNTSFGISNECGALEIYEMKYKVILDKSQEFKKIPINTDTVFIQNLQKSTETILNNWFLGGKVDGLLKKKDTDLVRDCLDLCSDLSRPMFGSVQDRKTERKENDIIKIIEVKTRTKCFFKTVRDYENTQMQIYMHMFNVDNIDLVEYMPQNRIKIKVTPIKKNKKVLSTIFKKIHVFIIQFEEFLNYSVEKKYDFFKMDLDDKKTFLQELYLNKCCSYD